MNEGDPCILILQIYKIQQFIQLITRAMKSVLLWYSSGRGRICVIAALEHIAYLLEPKRPKLTVYINQQASIVIQTLDYAFQFEAVNDEFACFR